MVAKDGLLQLAKPQMEVESHELAFSRCMGTEEDAGRSYQWQKERGAHLR